jgi:hypothetical protein
MADLYRPDEIEWRVFNMDYDKGDCVTRLHIGFTRMAYGENPHELTAHLEYLIHVDATGAWTAYKRDYSRTASHWREVNGVCEDAEPILKAALPKAQALAILKG